MVIMGCGQDLTTFDQRMIDCWSPKHWVCYHQGSNCTRFFSSSKDIAGIYEF